MGRLALVRWMEGLPGFVKDVYLGKGVGITGRSTTTASIRAVLSVARPGEDGGFALRRRGAKQGWRGILDVRGRGRDLGT